VPETATSANLSGGADPVSADAVRGQIGEAVDLILDGGECPIGVASTIVDCTGPEPKVLRQGVVSEEAILEVLRG
jgi:L-threonylcarbamoyladenylate synthase